MRIILCASEPRSLRQCSVQDCCSNLSRIKIFLRQHAGQSALVLVALHNAVQVPHGLGQITKSKQAGTFREESARTGMLDYGRFTTGWVARGTGAAPSIL